MSIEGQGHFFTIYFPGFNNLNALCFTRPRYQVSVYRTNGPLVILLTEKVKFLLADQASFSHQRGFIHNSHILDTGSG